MEALEGVVSYHVQDYSSALHSLQSAQAKWRRRQVRRGAGGAQANCRRGRVQVEHWGWGAGHMWCRAGGGA